MRRTQHNYIYVVRWKHRILIYFLTWILYGGNKRHKNTTSTRFLSKGS